MSWAPRSSLSVIFGDWARLPEIADNPDLAEDVREIQSELARCKAIVGGILLSAGEIRGENSEATTMRTFLGQIVAEWRGRMAGALLVEDRFGEDRSIVADPALRQVIGNVIDNAVEVSPARVDIAATQADGTLHLAVRDYAPRLRAGHAGARRPPLQLHQGAARAAASACFWWSTCCASWAAPSRCATMPKAAPASP